ncbi:MAG: hypothetical protein JSV78_08520 [Phycisphaerales bacterium]|nr:MAG: hypothetical protein JSV78_08520 [Phycisphaerales bacterium]
MFTKRSAIVALVGVNLFFLAVLVLGSYALPAAHAQSRGRAGDFVCVTATVSGQSYDVLYILDVPKGTLHALAPDARRNLAYVGFTDLQNDFRGGQQP